MTTRTQIQITQDAIDNFERVVHFHNGKTFDDPQDSWMRDLMVAGMESQLESLYEELGRLAAEMKAEKSK